MTLTILGEYDFYGFVIFCIMCVPSMIWPFFYHYLNCSYFLHGYKEEGIEHSCTQTSGHFLKVVFSGNISVGETGRQKTLSEILIHNAT